MNQKYVPSLILLSMVGMLLAAELGFTFPYTKITVKDLAEHPQTYRDTYVEFIATVVDIEKRGSANGAQTYNFTVIDDKGEPLSIYLLYNRTFAPPEDLYYIEAFEPGMIVWIGGDVTIRDRFTMITILKTFPYSPAEESAVPLRSVKIDNTAPPAVVIKNVEKAVRKPEPTPTVQKSEPQPKTKKYSVPKVLTGFAIPLKDAKSIYKSSFTLGVQLKREYDVFPFGGLSLFMASDANQLNSQEHVRSDQFQSATLAGGISFFFHLGKILTLEPNFALGKGWIRQALRPNVNNREQVYRYHPLTMQGGIQLLFHPKSNHWGFGVGTSIHSFKFLVDERYDQTLKEDRIGNPFLVLSNYVSLYYCFK